MQNYCVWHYVCVCFTWQISLYLQSFLWLQCKALGPIQLLSLCNCFETVQLYLKCSSKHVVHSSESKRKESLVIKEKLHWSVASPTIWMGQQKMIWFILQQQTVMNLTIHFRKNWRTIWTKSQILKVPLFERHWTLITSKH